MLLQVNDYESLELSQWEQGLPSEVRMSPAAKRSATPHRLMLHLWYWYLHLVLHRPFHRVRTGLDNSRIDHSKVIKLNTLNPTKLIALTDL